MATHIPIPIDRFDLAHIFKSDALKQAIATTPVGGNIKFYGLDMKVIETSASIVTLIIVNAANHLKDFLDDEPNKDLGIIELHYKVIDKTITELYLVL